MGEQNMRTQQPIEQTPLNDLEAERAALEKKYTDGSITPYQTVRLREINAAINQIRGAYRSW